MSSSRQLAAIMFTDIVGYTALMGSDEKKAFQLLKKNREIQKLLIKQYNGTWIKELGDGVLASFHTVTDAVFCAAAIHKGCDAVDGLKLRIGIHLGKVVFENNDFFGANWIGLALAYQFNNQPVKVLQTIEAAESLSPNITFLKVILVRVNSYNNKFEEAIQAFDRIDSLSEIKFHPQNLSFLAIAYYKTGQINKGEIFLKELKRKSQHTSVGSPYFHLAAVYAALGKKDLAIQSLEKAYFDHEVEMYWLKVTPQFISLRNDKRSPDIVNRIGYSK